MESNSMWAKMKPSLQDGPTKSKLESFSSRKKIEVKSKPSPLKTAPKRVTKARAKKVYNLPGQKHDPPKRFLCSSREPLRIFYESLFNQLPTSDMAEFWMMEHSFLSPDRAKRAFEKKRRKQKPIRTGTPVKSPNISSKPECSQRPPVSRNDDTTKANKRVVQESDDEDFFLSSKRRKG